MQLEWVKKVKKATSIVTENMSGLDKLLVAGEDEPGTILVEGILISYPCHLNGVIHTNPYLLKSWQVLINYYILMDDSTTILFCTMPK